MNINMKKFVIIFFLFCNISNSQNIWEETLSDADVPLGIECPDTINCYIFSSQGTPYTLHKSSDQGKTWEMIYSIFKPEFYDLEDMSVPDTNNIFLIFEKGHILKSVDGGYNYKQIILDGITVITNIEMLNKNIGIINVAGGRSYITDDSWKTFSKAEPYPFGTAYNPTFINDSIVLVGYRFTEGTHLLKLNIKSNQYHFNYIDVVGFAIDDLCVVTENLLFVCGKSNSISGGSGHDAIYKSTDGGENWRRVLDIHPSDTDNKLTGIKRFGLQSIAFKDSLTGIAVGQFGKIVYTYDGGESWIYESKLPPQLGGGESNPPTMLVRYAGSVPLIAAFNGTFHRFVKDNLAPGPEDIYNISGRVWEGTNGQPGIPVSLGYRVTMTDSNGYYKFTQLKQGNYKVRALNKYYDATYPDLQVYYYKPFDYKPMQYDIELTRDTSGFDFNAEDLRTFYSASGYIKDVEGKGKSNITLKIKDSTAVTDSSGMFLFPKIESKRQYDLTPFSEDYTFSPAFHTINLITGDTTGLVFTASPITSVWESKKQRGIVITPNPAGDFITIQTSEVFETSEVYNVHIFDILGIEVMSVGTGLDLSTQRIDISHLPTGVYFIRIGDKVEKFVKI